MTKAHQTHIIRARFLLIQDTNDNVGRHSGHNEHIIRGVNTHHLRVRILLRSIHIIVRH